MAQEIDRQLGGDGVDTTNNSLDIIITGGAGCIGFAIVKALLRHYPNASIHVLDIAIPPLQDVNSSYSQFAQQKDRINFHEVDITNTNTLSSLFGTIKPKAVFHTASVIPSAARKQRLTKNRLWEVNVNGTKNVLDAAQQVGTVEALVYTSSCDVVKPDSWMDFVNASEKETEHLLKAKKWDSEYPKTKAAAEILVLAPDLKIRSCAIRTHGVIGTLDQNIFPLIATSPRKISLGSGKNLYDFTSADNVAMAHILAMNNLLSRPKAQQGGGSEEQRESASGRAFFVSDGRPKPFRELQEMIWREFDKEAPPEKGYDKYTVIPVWLFAGVIRFVGLFTKTQISPTEIGDAVATRYFDISEARRVLGYDPSLKTLEESIEDACEWWRKKKIGEERK